jgi:alkaline phosphatase D
VPTPFGHGVASFEPTARSVVLWTCVPQQVSEVRLLVGTDQELAEVIDDRRVAVPHDRGGTVAVDVEGLEPATTYWYAFVVGDVRSPVGRTRTLPETGAEQLRLGLVSCARYSVAPLGVYRAVAEAPVDLVLHLGDYLYEDDGSSGPRPHDPPHDAVTLDDYRRRYAQIRADPDAQAMHQAHPVLAIWDDHDLADNAWRTGAKAHDPDEHGDWDDRVRAAALARDEWLPCRPLDRDDVRTTWREVELGDLASLLLLDTRWVGRDRHAGDEGASDRDDPDRSLLGDEQRAWLHRRVGDAEQPWALVASGVVVNQIALPWPRLLRPIDALLPNGYAVAGDEIVHDDQWDGYTAERDALAEAMGRRATDGRRSIVLSGDVHSSWAFEGPCDRSGAPVAVEVTTPAVSSAAMARAHHPGLAHLIDRGVQALDHVRWAEVTRRGYATLELRRDRAVATWWFVDPWSRDPSATTELGRCLVTEVAPWPPRWEPAEPAPSAPVDEDRRVELPPRPEDLPRVRRRRRARLGAEVGGAAAAVLAGAVALRRWGAAGRS